jgi:hypothetical protein
VMDAEHSRQGADARQSLARLQFPGGDQKFDLRRDLLPQRNRAFLADLDVHARNTLAIVA